MLTQNQRFLKLQVSDNEKIPVIVKALIINEECIRLVVNCNISESDVEDAIRKICSVVNEFKN